MGRDPLPRANAWAERLIRGRTVLGFSQKEFARKLNVDPSTLARWESGDREPAGAFATRAERLLRAAEGLEARRAG